jgi:uncharacterized protein with HEPN domain
MKIIRPEDRANVLALLLNRLVESGHSAIEFLGQLDLEQFQNDRLRQSAVSMALGKFGQTIGQMMELFPEIVERHPDIK